jgi:hypothetical protein
MRSPIGPILVVFGLATIVVLVLVLFQNLGMRSELEAARAEVDSLRAAVVEMEPGVTDEELVRRLEELEGGIRDWLIATGADGGVQSSPGTDPATGSALVDRLDEVLARIQALDDRIDEICENVPVC